MPKSMFPQDSRLFWLSSDAELPLDSRPVFLCNSPTRTLSLEWTSLGEEAVKLGTGPEAYELLGKMIGLGVNGWRNFGEGTFSIGSLDELLTEQELQELAFGWPRAFEMTAAEKAKAAAVPSEQATSDSPPTTPTPLAAETT